MVNGSDVLPHHRPGCAVPDQWQAAAKTNCVSFRLGIASVFRTNAVRATSRFVADSGQPTEAGSDRGVIRLPGNMSETFERLHRQGSRVRRLPLGSPAQKGTTNSRYRNTTVEDEPDGREADRMPDMGIGFSAGVIDDSRTFAPGRAGIDR